MKKISILLFAAFYLLSSTGIVVNFHYCMGSLTEWSFSSQKSDLCDACGMEKGTSDSENCCKDEYKQLKVDSHRNLVKVAAAPISLYIVTTLLFFTQQNFYKPQISAGKKLVLNSSPPIVSIGLYLFKRLLLI